MNGIIRHYIWLPTQISNPFSSDAYKYHHHFKVLTTSTKPKKPLGTKQTMSSKPFLASLPLLVMTLTLALTLRSAWAQDSPQDYINAHNKARAAVGVGPMTWDNKVAAYAQNYANQRAANGCNLVHSGGPYGENLAWSSADMSGTAAVQMWVDEKAYYNYDTNSCAPGKVCGHYTQVVWRNSVRLGCAKVHCNGGQTFIGCNYDPPGNYIGQKPY